MCGQDLSTAIRVGARVDLFSESKGSLLGSLVFFDPALPKSSTATHVRFTSASEYLGLPSQMLVSIHSTGDMTQPVHRSGMFQQFRLEPGSKPENDTETALDKPLLLNVGGDGIIGRRVSMTQQPGPRSRHFPRAPLAEGIVGYNC